MTRSEWATKHPDFRATIDGRPYVLSDEGARGTCLVPVELVADSLPVYRVECAWCKVVIVEGSAGAPVSHDICPKCLKEVGA